MMTTRQPRHDNEGALTTTGRLDDNVTTNDSQLLDKVAVTRLPPCVDDSITRNPTYRVDDPLRHFEARRSPERLGQILAHHEVSVDLAHVRLVWLVKANVDGLNQAGTSGGDELDLNTKAFDGLGDTPKKMDFEGVQEDDGDHAGGGRCNVRSEHILNPVKHDCFVKPRFLLHCIVAFVRMQR
jgi:hypothetical protein